MLADTILAERGGMMDRLTGGSVTALAQAIRRAARFDLTPGVVVSGYAVRQTSLRALPAPPANLPNGIASAPVRRGRQLRPCVSGQGTRPPKAKALGPLAVA